MSEREFKTVFHSATLVEDSRQLHRAWVAQKPVQTPLPHCQLHLNSLILTSHGSSRKLSPTLGPNLLSSERGAGFLGLWTPFELIQTRACGTSDPYHRVTSSGIAHQPSHTWPPGTSVALVRLGCWLIIAVASDGFRITMETHLRVHL